MNDDFTVSVRVSPTLWEYHVCLNGGSDIVRLDWKSPLWVLVKSNLQLVPKDGYEPQLPQMRKGILRLELPKPYSHMDPLYSESARKSIGSKSIFRNYLDENAQRHLEQYMAKEFKMRYREFMTGALSCNLQLQIKDAIERFCEVYELSMDAITYEMLRKDWYRYRMRESRGDPAAEIKENF